MSKIKDGGTAFPMVVYSANHPENLNGLPAFGSRSSDGMSLRDYFAAKAMQGEVAACQSKRAEPDDVAKFAYDVADAMLRARTQEPSQGKRE